MASDATTLLPEAAATEAHKVLSGRASPLADLLKPGARLAVPVNPGTIHALESLHLLAAERGASLALTPPVGLDERQTDFLADFRKLFLKQSVPEAEGPGPIRHDAWVWARSLAGIVLKGGLPRRRPVPKVIRSVAIIGAYGGEHAGDAAILAGVLCGLAQDYGTTQACILSQRPSHTARLAASLDTPVAVTVRPYTHAELRRALEPAGALVFAGGPLMDLPRMLAKHLAAARHAHATGKPFLIRRIGVGPFARRLSEATARLIARHADTLSVRTTGASRHAVVRDIPVEIGRDPAFDYLEPRHALTRLAPEDLASVGRLLAGTEGRIRIGINLRPIPLGWSKQGPDYSRREEEALYSRLADAILATEATSKRPISWIFFPMNPIQLGASDLAAAWRLHRLVGGRADFRVWEADPDVDGILHLLRQLDGAIAMRFHAAIFCLSQRLPTIGIDYYPGQGGKVEQLFQDQGRAGFVRRVDTADADWLKERLADFVRNPGQTGQNRGDNETLRHHA